jgi:hypothetical protein
MSATPTLLTLLRRRLADPKKINDGADTLRACVYPVCDVLAIEAAEEQLGFPLPSLLRWLYLTVGNGGYGPGYGLIGARGGAKDDDTGRDLVGIYSLYSRCDGDDALWTWPDRLLPVCHLGCAMYACLDCNDDAAPVVWFEPNPHEAGKPWDESFLPVCDSLEMWLQMWLDNIDWMDVAWKRRFGVSIHHPT